MQTNNPFAASLAESQRKRWRIAAIATLALLVVFMGINLFLGIFMTYAMNDVNGIPQTMPQRTASIYWWSGGLALLVAAVSGVLMAKKQFKTATLVNAAGLLMLVIVRFVLVFSTMREVMEPTVPGGV